MFQIGQRLKGQKEKEKEKEEQARALCSAAHVSFEAPASAWESLWLCLTSVCWLYFMLLSYLDFISSFDDLY